MGYKYKKGSAYKITRALMSVSRRGFPSDFFSPFRFLILTFSNSSRKCSENWIYQFYETNYGLIFSQVRKKLSWAVGPLQTPRSTAVIFLFFLLKNWFIFTSWQNSSEEYENLRVKSNFAFSPKFENGI